ncbi:M56 family metallopeptidase [Gramella lutea]|uniref:M56 family metallopeptidase n=1 Tax=Christiangramia lutea TaxID=1607951 RepID=A0A9X1V1R2_9FLAO|nr:M56 family metallopeptidase [Christiangramia lutea]MCH4822051.1 M56 family metallopeptidase [Christiangramia lutea]
MIHYILQVLFFQLLFLMIYDLFLKKETFFNYNRLYLLITPVLAFIIPYLKLQFIVNSVPENARLIIPPSLTTQPELYVQNLPLVIINTEGAWEPNWWVLSYLTGFIISLGFFGCKYFHLKKLKNSGSSAYENGIRIINVPESKIAYTFFNTIYLGNDLSKKEKQQILSHELVHVKQKHTYDLVFFEFLKVVIWFNPLVYIFQSRIAGVHEYIADHEVVKTVSRKTYFEQLLNSAFNTKDISFTNQFFNQSLIKKRIVMLQKNKSSKLSKFKFLLVVPLMLAMLTYVACSDDQKIENITEQSNAENFLTVEIEDFENRTPEEKAKMKEAFDELANSEGYTAVKIIDKKKTIIYNKNAPDGTPSITVENNNGKTSKLNSNNSQEGLEKYGDEIPYAVIEKTPAYKGCQEYTGEVRKKCTSTEISSFVNENFDTSLGKKLGLTGINRVIVQFRIDETGEIQDVKARAPHPELEAEAIRVIASIPQMEPGKHNGKLVSVMYSLPIAFKVN